MNIQRIVQIIFQLLIFGAVVACLYYLITIVPIPPPWQGWILVALKVLVILGVIAWLLDLGGVPIIRRGGGPPSSPPNPPG